jgi:hypothetical protein
VAKSLREQLREAFDASGLTIVQLRSLAGLGCDGSSLSRKLSGHQSLRDFEIEALALALRVRISTGRSARPTRRAAA